MSTPQYAYGTETSVQIQAIWCSGCGVPYGLPQGYAAARQEDGKSWRCPNGCSQVYVQTEAQRLSEELDAARSLASRESDRRRLAESQRAAARGEITRLRKRVGNGVCPCCNRTFKDLGQHMAGQHPEFRLDEEEPNPTIVVADLTPNQLWTLQMIGRHLDGGDEGGPTYAVHGHTLKALVRRLVVEVVEDTVIPTPTGLRLIAAAGSGNR
jgi:hypothetical protein